jgi:hypothetical protein
VTGLRQVGALAAEAGVALQQDRLGRGECQAVGEAGGLVAERGAVGVGVALEAPVADMHARVGERRRRPRRMLVAAPARDAFGMQQLPAGQIGEGRVGEQQLPRGKAAGQIGGQTGA